MSEEYERSERGSSGIETAREHDVHGDSAFRGVSGPSEENDPRSGVRAVVSQGEVRAHLARPDVRADIARFVRAKVRPRDADDVTGAVDVAVLSAQALPATADALPFWIHTITARVIADHTRKRMRRAKYEGDVPPDIDGIAGDEPTIERPAEAADLSLTPWLERQVADNPRDAETLAILKEKARSQKTYDELAEALGMSAAALKKRVARFSAHYAEKRRLRERKALGVVLVAVAVGLAVIFFVMVTSRPRNVAAPYRGPDVTAPGKDKPQTP